MVHPVSVSGFYEWGMGVKSMNFHGCSHLYSMQCLQIYKQLCQDCLTVTFRFTSWLEKCEKFTSADEICAREWHDDYRYIKGMTLI